MRKARNRRPGRPPQVEVDEPTAEKILRAAADCFMEEGFAAASMDEVADRAGVTKAVVYYYFGSKTDLFQRAMMEVMRASRERTQAILREGGPLSERLRKLTRTRLAIPATLDMNHILRGSQRALRPEQLEEMHQAEERLVEVIAQELAEEMARGRLRQIDAMFAARSYLALLGMGQVEIRRRGGGQAVIDEVAEELVDLLWRGIEPT
ncbi:TetR/AcrR family transcriptional regulator [Alicyclobacillus sendaiensis]|uniref:TetR/AcrR family transcriptional regulator n=1 Tax=Alicyclobacillus sendaiensis PA2 TaxID=3029425 RepID=A0ABT6Y031_ALISE|nr:TetR/AcrR family transcriptional regulator [Alicyclobacillus sendaiensis]MDI9260699.1 TetR/AcrR family transcriptional regulator [Alicyclobacillus sendaiensis PA2]